MKVAQRSNHDNNMTYMKAKRNFSMNSQDQDEYQ